MNDYTETESDNGKALNPEAEKLKAVLSKALGTKVTHTDYQVKQLRGGTLGDVRLITGIAETGDGTILPYSVVLKKQKKWERHGDLGSWRREYDLYASGFGKQFCDSLRWPKCYHAEINEEVTETQIWMEYIGGISGLDLTGEMYERAAEELGRFQGKLYAEQPRVLRSLTNLSGVGYAKNFYLHYRSWGRVYDYIRSGDCEIPRHLCEMLIYIDDNADDIWNRIEKLPVVLCHRDFWVANIFYRDGQILLIDWDTAGWGYLGEDIASLIADEADVPHMIEHYQRCVPAYYRGFSEHADAPRISSNCVYELMLFMFGYRLVEWFLDADSPDEKKLQIDTLQKIYEIGGTVLLTGFVIFA